MSTPNPTHIDVIAKHSLEFSEFYDEWRCRCEHPEARWRGAGISVRPLHAAHVVSKLTDAGYSIVQPIGLEYAPCWQNEHGVHPLNSTTAWRKGAEDDVERLSADDPEIFLGVHYRTPWVAAAAEGEKP